MEKYKSSLKAPKGHAIPPLLSEFGAWLKRQPYGSVGWFGLKGQPVPKEWAPEAADRLQHDGFVFVHMPDGSLLALLYPKRMRRPVVVLLGSEGERETVAGSLEEFLLALAEGETGVLDLDEEDATGRQELRKWLAAHRVRQPKARDFDFQSYLDGAAQKRPPKPNAAESSSRIISSFSPFLRELASIVGCRADDPNLVSFISKKLGKKVPTTMNDRSDMKYVTADKLGVEMGFSHDISHEAYPLIEVAKRSYIPYLQIVWLREKFPERLPFGLEFGLSEADIAAILGKPSERDTLKRCSLWQKVLDPQRGVVLRFSAKRKSMSIEVR